MLSPSLVVQASLPLFLASVAEATFYDLAKSYTPSNIFTDFDFYTGNDPTNGFVDYVDGPTAVSLGLVNGSPTSVYVGADKTNVYSTSSTGRPSVRLESKDRFTQGLFIFDINHMPVGCGVWPAFWTVGPAWPYDGEIDIIEGVSEDPTNRVSLHTSDGCAFSPSQGQTGKVLKTDCASGAGTDNSGCASLLTNPQNFGTAFNANGGGVYAMEWTSSNISIWFFPRGYIPHTIIAGVPKPATWPAPAVTYQTSSACNIDEHFSNHTIVIDTTFCGDYAGKAYGSATQCPQVAGLTPQQSCTQFVANNPQAMSEAYWDINSLRVYQTKELPPVVLPVSESVSPPSTASVPDTVQTPASLSAAEPTLPPIALGVAPPETNPQIPPLLLPQTVPTVLSPPSRRDMLSRPILRRDLPIPGLSSLSGPADIVPNLAGLAQQFQPAVPQNLPSIPTLQAPPSSLTNLADVNNVLNGGISIPGYLPFTLPTLSINSIFPNAPRLHTLVPIADQLMGSIPSGLRPLTATPFSNSIGPNNLYVPGLLSTAQNLPNLLQAMYDLNNGFRNTFTQSPLTQSTIVQALGSVVRPAYNIVADTITSMLRAMPRNPDGSLIQPHPKARRAVTTEDAPGVPSERGISASTPQTLGDMPTLMDTTPVGVRGLGYTINPNYAVLQNGAGQAVEKRQSGTVPDTVAAEEILANLAMYRNPRIGSFPGTGPASTRMSPAAVELPGTVDASAQNGVVPEPIVARGFQA